MHLKLHLLQELDRREHKIPLCTATLMQMPQVLWAQRLSQEEQHLDLEATDTAKSVRQVEFTEVPRMPLRRTLPTLPTPRRLRMFPTCLDHTTKKKSHTISTTRRNQVRGNTTKDHTAGQMTNRLFETFKLVVIPELREHQHSHNKAGYPKTSKSKLFKSIRGVSAHSFGISTHCLIYPVFTPSV